MVKSAESTDGETRSYPSDYAWRKSSRSMSDGHCVEVALSSRHVLMRDSKNVTGPQLAFDKNAWDSFVEYIKLRQCG